MRSSQAGACLPQVCDCLLSDRLLDRLQQNTHIVNGLARIDMLMALALIHHLAIANNVPLNNVADFFAQLGRDLIIEWVPKTDVQVKRLLAARVMLPEYSPQSRSLGPARSMRTRQLLPSSRSAVRR